MRAKLIRVIKNSEGGYHWTDYEYECIKCGEHFIRCQCHDRINPYCGSCQREIDYEKQKERNRKKLIEIYDRGYQDGIHDGYFSTLIQNGTEESKYNPPT